MTSFMPSARVFLANVELSIVPEKAVAGMNLYYQTMVPLRAFNLART